MTEEIDNILDYLKKAGLNTISTNSPAWKVIHNVNGEKIIDKTIEYKNGQKMTVGLLVRHRTVPALGIGLVVSESKAHKGFWMIQWCDPRYYDVGTLGIDEDYLEIV